MSWQLKFTSPVHLFQFMGGKVKDRGETFTINIMAKRDFSAKFQIFELQAQESVLETDIKSALNVQFSTNDRRVFFDVRYNDKLYNFSMVFGSRNELSAFVRSYTQCLFENTEMRPFSEEDQEEISRFVLYMSLDDLQPSAEDDGGGEEVPMEYAATGRADSGRNTILRSSERTKNSLVLRRYDTKSSLGLFELDKDCKFRQAIPTIETDLGSKLLATDMLTINKDKNLLLLDETNNKMIFNMDLNRGDVVSHYDTSFNGTQQPVVKLMPTTADGEDTSFLGYNSRNTMRFDPRTESLVEKSEYKTDNHFTAGTTSVNGKMVMGSDNGILRLYSGPCKTRATTNFQANVGNQPIISIEISPDEEWILAACPYYLSLINTKNQASGRLAFDSPMGKDKPPCERLIISQEHQQLIAKYHNGDMPPFSSAKFELRGAKIISIVGTVGTAIVAWDFKRIVSGKRPTYKISLVGGEIIVDNKPIEITRDVLFMSENQLSMIAMNK